MFVSVNKCVKDLAIVFVVLCNILMQKAGQISDAWIWSRAGAKQQLSRDLIFSVNEIVDFLIVWQISLLSFASSIHDSAQLCIG
mgnify:CR=1 FL=1